MYKAYNYYYMQVVVLAGGKSDEREVSLKSGQAVYEALIKAGHDVIIIDPVKSLKSVVISK